MTGITINGFQVNSARLVVPWNGVWFVDLDTDIVPAPSGRVLLTIGSSVLSGTVDPSQTGVNGFKSSVRVVGGGGGWGARLGPTQLHNDAGVTTTEVLSVTAAAAGEIVVDESPRSLGVDYVRGAGFASAVLAGAPWHVDASGFTHAGLAWPSTPSPAGCDVLDWDPMTRTASIAVDGPVWPGAILVDAKFGSAVIRDVEIVFDETGARGRARCELTSPTDSGTALVRAIGAIAKAGVRPQYLRSHEYRLVTQGIDGRVTLQAVNPGESPEILQTVPVWPGTCGVDHRFSLGSIVTVEFVSADPARPIVTGFSSANVPPLVTTIRADAVKIGSGAFPVIRSSSDMVTWINAVTTYVNGIAPGTLVAPSAAASTKLFSD